MKPCLFCFIILLSACGRTFQQPSTSLADASTAVPNFTLIPEYAKTNAIMLEAGGHFVSRDFDPEDSDFKRTLGTEYETLVNALVGSPDLRIIMYLSTQDLTNIFPSASPQTEVEHFKATVMPSLVGGGKTIEMRETTTSFDEPDPWTRDFGAFTALEKDTGRLVLVDHQKLQKSSRGASQNQDLAQVLGLPKFDIANQAVGGPISVDGGGIMNDSRGRCFASPVTPDNSWQCTEVVGFRPLPQDSTGHIDLFAKLLSDDVAVVADFSSDQVLLAVEPEIKVSKCAAADNGGEKECIPESRRPSFNRFEQNKNGSGDRLFSIAELKDLLASRYTQQVIWKPTVSKSPQWQDFHLREFSEETAAKLRERGFAVTKILNPAPIAYVSINRLLEGDKVISEEISLKFAYRSHLNSLVVNGRVLMPIFGNGDATSNEKAKAAYASLGFSVTGIPMDAHAFQDGAVHCLTRDLHDGGTTAGSNSNQVNSNSLNQGGSGEILPAMTEGCDYTNASKPENKGYGYNPELKKSCAPQGS